MLGARSAHLSSLSVVEACFWEICNRFSQSTPCASQLSNFRRMQAVGGRIDLGAMRDEGLVGSGSDSVLYYKRALQSRTPSSKCSLVPSAFQEALATPTAILTYK